MRCVVCVEARKKVAARVTWRRGCYSENPTFFQVFHRRSVPSSDAVSSVASIVAASVHALYNALARASSLENDVTAAQKAAEQPSPIPHGGGFFQHSNQVNLVFDFSRQRSAREILQGAFAACMFDQPVFDFEEVADLFELEGYPIKACR